MNRSSTVGMPSSRSPLPVYGWSPYSPRFPSVPIAEFREDFHLLVPVPAHAGRTKKSGGPKNRRLLLHSVLYGTEFVEARLMPLLSTFNLRCAGNQAALCSTKSNQAEAKEQHRTRLRHAQDLFGLHFEESLEECIAISAEIVNPESRATMIIGEHSVAEISVAHTAAGTRRRAR